MKPYVSIDIETTGLDPDDCQIIQFGAVVDDLVSPLELLPRFEVLVLNRNDEYCGSSFALNMNRDILSRISDTHQKIEKQQAQDLSKFCFQDELGPRFANWLQSHIPEGGSITVAGKNFSGFDKLFLENINFFEFIKVRHRVIDVGSMYWQVSSDGTVLPNLKQCMERAGLEGEVLHTALDDALVVTKLIRKHFNIGD